MNISIFDVTGPVMIGPSSSHTAGAAKLARIARLIAGRPFSHVSFGLHGSLAKTYRGHGTDRALVAGAMGFMEDDERLADAFEIAKERGLSYDFYETELDGVHENSAVISFALADPVEVVGSSIGGARIVIRKVNGFDTEFTAAAPTLLIRQRDQRGIISETSRILADAGLNIGVMRLSRRAKGDEAFCVVETDSPVPKSVTAQIASVKGILHVSSVDPLGNSPIYGNEPTAPGR